MTFAICSNVPLDNKKSLGKLGHLIMSRYPLKYVKDDLKISFSPFDTDQQRSAYLGLLLFEAYGDIYKMENLLNIVSTYLCRKGKEHFAKLKLNAHNPHLCCWEFDPEFDPYKVNFRGKEFRNVLIPHTDLGKWLKNASLQDQAIDKILTNYSVFGQNLSVTAIFLDGYKLIEVLFNRFHRPLAIDSNLEIILSTFLLKCFSNPLFRDHLSFSWRKLFYAKVFSLSLIPSLQFFIETDLLELINSAGKMETALTELPYMTKRVIGLLACVLNYSPLQIRHAILNNSNWLNYFCKDSNRHHWAYLHILQELVIDRSLKQFIRNDIFENVNLYYYASCYPSSFFIKDILFDRKVNQKDRAIYINDANSVLIVLLPDNDLLIMENNAKICTAVGSVSYFAVSVDRTYNNEKNLCIIKDLLLKAKRLIEGGDEVALHFLVNNRIIHLI